MLKGWDCFEEGNSNSNNQACKRAYLNAQDAKPSSRRPHQESLLSARNRKPRLQFAIARKNRTTENCTNIIRYEFLLWHLDGEVRTWCKHHESVVASCFITDWTLVHMTWYWNKVSEECFHRLVEFMPWRMQSWKQNGLQPSASKVHLIKRSVNVALLYSREYSQYGTPKQSRYLITLQAKRKISRLDFVGNYSRNLHLLLFRSSTSSFCF